MSIQSVTRRSYLVVKCSNNFRHVSSPPASWLRCLLPWVMVWVLSGVGAVWGCVRVLYLWEPVTPLHSPKSVSFWRHRRQADLHLNRVSADEAWSQKFSLKQAK